MDILKYLEKNKILAPKWPQNMDTSYHLKEMRASQFLEKTHVVTKMASEYNMNL